jgi:hypothetical protein
MTMVVFAPAPVVVGRGVGVVERLLDGRRGVCAARGWAGSGEVLLR